VQVALLTGKNARLVPDEAPFTQSNLLEDFWGASALPVFQRKARSLKEHVLNRSRVVRGVAADSPDLVHAQWPLTRFGVGVFRRIAARAPLVITAHNAIPHDCSDPEIINYWGRIYGTADAIVCHSEETKAEITQLYGHFLTASLPVIPLGTGVPSWETHHQLSKLDARRSLSLEDVPTVLFFGAIRPYKGVDLLIDAWEHVVRRVPNARLVIAGQGATWLTIESRIRELGVERSVVPRIKWIDDDEISLYIRAADVVVLPYRKVDGSAVAMNAAMHEVPMVMTDIPGFRALWSDDEVTFASADSLGFAGGIISALIDRSAANIRASAARARTDAESSWARCAQDHIELYSRLIAGRSQ